MNDDGLWLVIVLCALPFAAFGIAEIVSRQRRKRERAIAQRRKDFG